MSPSRWQQIEAIFIAAQERAPADRAKYLDHACAGDEDLRREVESLLAQNSLQDRVLDRPVFDAAADTGDTQATATIFGPGTQIGPYRIEAPLGKGGMGEVLRAVDTRLGRTVAIKTSLQLFSARFEREARAIAALSHPNICTLYDVGPNYLVMEFCEGDTLAARIKRGRLSPEEACKIGSQVCDALAAAHAKGIVHRDLKPANIMLTKVGAKVLDFGLAKSESDPTLTVANAVMGTPAYMSPEQRQGQATDHRTDIYSFGLVLLEMVTGKRSIDEAESELAAMPQLQFIIERCLSADPVQRWQSAADVSRQLAFLAEPRRRVGLPAATASGPNRRTVYVWTAAGALALGGGFAFLHWLRPPAAPVAEAPPVRFALSLDSFESNGFETIPRPSPDGRYLAFLGKGSAGKLRVWLRAFSESEAHPLENTDDASTLFWSPDSRWIAFYSASEGKVKKVSTAGGPAQTMFAVATDFQEPVWGSKGEILYRPLNREPLYRISESGGKPVQVTTLDKQRTENSHRGHQFLPDGRRFLFVARCGDRAMNALYLGSLDTAKIKRLAPIDSVVRFAAIPGTERGRVFYYRDGALVFRTLNLSTEELEGEPTVFLEHVGYNPTGLGISFNASADARVAVWRDGSADLPRLVWYSRSGERQGEVGEADNRIQIRLSPDGTRVAYAGVDPQSGNRDVFLMDLARGIPTRLTDNIANEWYPAWSPDSKNLAFVSDRPAGGAFAKPAEGTSAPETRYYAGPFSPGDWSRDGRWLGGYTTDNQVLWVAEAKPGATPVKILPPSRARNDGLRFSPDGRWIAYVSDESGEFEIYVRRFLGTAMAPESIRLTRGGADYPVWNPKGDELFYVTRDLSLWTINTRNLGNGALPEPTRLFRFCEPGVFVNMPLTRSSYLYPYDTLDGKRFLANCTTEPLARFSLLVNPRFGK